MLRRAVARARPQRARFPAGIGVVNAAFEPLREKTHRIGHTQLDDLAADQRVQRIRLVAGLDRHIGAEPEYVVLVDPHIIRVLLGAGIALEARPRQCIEIEALGAFLAVFGARPVERSLALATVEAGDVTAVERQPSDAVAVDIHAADAEAGKRHLVDLGKRGVGRIWPRIETDDVAGMRQVRAPDRAVNRRPGDCIHAKGQPSILGVIGRLTRLVVALVTLAVAIGIYDEWGPAL